MNKQVPQYVKDDVRKLNNALARVAEYAAAIEKWVDDNTGEDGMEFFYNNHLDNPYEFNYAETLEALKRALNG